MAFAPSMDLVQRFASVLEELEYRSMTRRRMHGRKVNFGRWLCIATRRKGFGSVQGLGAFLRPSRYHVAGCANLTDQPEIIPKASLLMAATITISAFITIIFVSSKSKCRY